VPSNGERLYCLQISLHGVAEADLSEWCNSWRARFLRERLYISRLPLAKCHLSGSPDELHDPMAGGAPTNSQPTGLISTISPSAVRRCSEVTCRGAIGRHTAQPPPLQRRTADAEPRSRGGDQLVSAENCSQHSSSPARHVLPSMAVSKCQALYIEATCSAQSSARVTHS